MENIEPIKNILVSVGKKTTTGGHFLYAEGCEIKCSIFPHKSWQGGIFKQKGDNIPPPNVGEKWVCNLYEKTNLTTGKVYYVATPVEFISYDLEKKMQEESFEISARLLKIKPILDEKDYEYNPEKSNQSFLVFSNSKFEIKITPRGIQSRKLANA